MLLIAGIVLLALVGIAAIGASAGMRYVRTMTVEPVDLSRIADGVYSGSFSKGRFSYTVEVTVKGRRIEAAKPTGTAQAANPMVGQILDRIVQEQSAVVDTVSGASLTTKAVSRAVENALRQDR